MTLINDRGEQVHVVPGTALPPAAAFLDQNFQSGFAQYTQIDVAVQYTGQAFGQAIFRPEFRDTLNVNYVDTRLVLGSTQNLETILYSGLIGAANQYIIHVCNSGFDQFRLNVRESGVPPQPGTIGMIILAVH